MAKVVVGIDLAGNPKNDTGFCVLTATETLKDVSTEILHSDQEIIEKVEIVKPEVIAIDAPLTYFGENRKCDELLKEYGTLPVTLRGMEVLAIRGRELRKKLESRNFNVIEIFATASAKILGLYAETEKEMQKNLLNSNIKGAIERKFLNKDELDAIFAAITAYMYTENLVDFVGDEKGRIAIPKV
ncbi:MAG: DUF429 domain-containing protein [Candidatus Altiarchaeota archaeon]